MSFSRNVISLFDLYVIALTHMILSYKLHPTNTHLNYYLNLFNTDMTVFINIHKNTSFFDDNTFH